MWRSPEPRYDVASALCQGGRDYQEDAIVTDFPFGSDSGVVVLADGMGGHAAGDVPVQMPWCANTSRKTPGPAVWAPLWCRLSWSKTGCFGCRSGTAHCT